MFTSPFPCHECGAKVTRRLKTLLRSAVSKQRRGHARLPGALTVTGTNYLRGDELN